MKPAADDHEKIFHYRSGRPFETGAVIMKGAKKLDARRLSNFFTIRRMGGKTTLKYTFTENDRMYGLGECLGSLDRRGRRYRLFATDDPNHTPEKESLYGVHPFAIISGPKTFGFFIDYPSEIVVDAGFTDRNVLEMTIGSADFDLYIFDSREIKRIVRDYLLLTGRPYVPPKWAFGYQQCRWSYPDRASVRDVADNFLKRGIPCDAIYLDIDYMKDYKVFTVDRKKFPAFEKFVSDLRKKGIRLIAIIDPGVKIEKGYDVYEEGAEFGYFCRDEKGGYFSAAVWPGLTHFPDFLDPRVRKWWGKLYERLTDLGVEGFWNDMNEPAIFYTPETQAWALEFAAGIPKKRGAPAKKIDALREKLNDMGDVRAHYGRFYHATDGESSVLHEKVHNVYAFYMSLAAADGLESHTPGRRHFLLSRASYAGMHRFSAVWTGDNASWWEHMIVHMRMVTALNMAGFFYSGADVGGFGCDASADLLIRWTQLGALTPLFRNHSAIGTRRQEPWAFGEETGTIIRNIIRLRYSLIPYLYSEFMRSVGELSPFISPLFLEYTDFISAETDDQFLVGRSLMAAPVHAQNAAGRHVHLPEHRWLFWAAANAGEREMKVMEPGAHYVRAALNEIPLFIAENSMIALDAAWSRVGKKPATPGADPAGLIVAAFVTDRASFDYYADDGETRDYEKGAFSKLTIEITRRGGRYETSVTKRESPLAPLKVRTIEFEIYDEAGRRHSRSMNL